MLYYVYITTTITTTTTTKESTARLIRFNTFINVLAGNVIWQISILQMTKHILLVAIETNCRL